MFFVIQNMWIETNDGSLSKILIPNYCHEKYMQHYSYIVVGLVKVEALNQIVILIFKNLISDNASTYAE